MERPTPRICRAILCSFAHMADCMEPRPTRTVVSDSMYSAIGSLTHTEDWDIDSVVERLYGLPPLVVEPDAHCHMTLR